MSLEQQIGALVKASENLTGAVNGKIGEIDEQLRLSIDKINQHLDVTKTMLPRILMTMNQTLVAGDDLLPLNFNVNANVTVTKVIDIAEGPGSRDIAQKQMLQEIEMDLNVDLRINEFYRKSFSIYKLAWSNNVGWLAFPVAADDKLSPRVPLNTYFTIGAFVKIVSGSLGGAWANGAVFGKWCFCSTKNSPAGFGTYTNLHPITNTESGEILVALPAAITGHIDNATEWFPNIELN